MSCKRFIVIGGRVYSSTDGQIHHVGARELCQLYGVIPAECVLTDERSDIEGLPDLPVLRPRHDGQYRLGLVAAAAIALKALHDHIPRRNRDIDSLCEIELVEDALFKAVQRL